METSSWKSQFTALKAHKGRHRKKQTTRQELLLESFPDCSQCYRRKRNTGSGERFLNLYNSLRTIYEVIDYTENSQEIFEEIRQIIDDENLAGDIADAIFRFSRTLEFDVPPEDSRIQFINTTIGIIFATDGLKRSLLKSQVLEIRQHVDHLEQVNP